MAPPRLRARTMNPVEPTAAFEALFEAHWSAVHAYARRRVPVAADAHDVAAETFAIAWRRFADVPIEHPLPWLYRTAGNVLHNQRRGARRRTRLDGKLASTRGRTPEDPADLATDDIVLVDAFRALSEEDREVLRLVAWEGLSNPDIAEVLGASTNAAALRVSRARRRLASSIAHAESAHARTGSPPTGHEEDDRAGTDGDRGGSRD